MTAIRKIRLPAVFRPVWPWINHPHWYRLAVLGLTILAALLVRVWVAWRHPFILPDSVDYDLLARQIIHGGSYEVAGMFAKRMPGYPVFLACTYAVFGFSHWAVLLVQGVMGAILTGVVYAMGRRLSPAAGLLAAALVAVDPLLIGFSAALLSEIPFTLIFTICLWLLLQLLDHPRSLPRWLLFGVGFLLAVYLRAEVALCIFPLLVWVVVMARPTVTTAGEEKVAKDTLRHEENHDPVAPTPRRTGDTTRREGKAIKRNNGLPWLGALMALLIIFVGLLPWWMRNYRLFGQDFFRFTTLQGISLYEAVYSGATGGPRQSDIAVPAALRGLGESRRDSAWTSMAWRTIRQNPRRILKLAAVKIVRTWSPWLHARGFTRPRINLPLTAWYIIVYIFALLGLAGAGRFPRRVGVLLIPILYFTMIHALFLGSVRYRVPVMPLVLILAAVGICRLAAIGQVKRP